MESYLIIASILVSLNLITGLRSTILVCDFTVGLQYLFYYDHLVVEEILRIPFIGRLAGLGLRVAFTAIKEHERNTCRVVSAASSALCHRHESMNGPDVITRAITRPHGVSTWDFVIEHILGISRAGLRTGLGLRVALFAIKIHERDTVVVVVASVGAL